MCHGLNCSLPCMSCYFALTLNIRISIPCPLYHFALGVHKWCLTPSLPSLRSARISLLSGVKEVRAGGLRVLRYLLTSREAFVVMLKHCIDLLVVRSLDAPPNREIERLQAVRFVRQALVLCPQIFPRSLISPLVSILMSTSEPQDNLTWSCMATLCELG